MYKGEKIATAVKQYLITLALADKLPLDLNELDEDSLREVIEDAMEDGEVCDKVLLTAGQYLSTDSDEEIADMVKAIVEHENQDDLIDYVDGVDVWEKVEFRFTCKEFLNLINYKKEV